MTTKPHVVTAGTTVMHSAPIPPSHDWFEGHQTKLDINADEFALQILRDQIEQLVYPVQRLGRKTVGVLLFGLNEVINKTM